MRPNGGWDTEMSVWQPSALSPPSGCCSPRWRRTGRTLPAVRTRWTCCAWSLTGATFCSFSGIRHVNTLMLDKSHGGGGIKFLSYTSHLLVTHVSFQEERYKEIFLDSFFTWFLRKGRWVYKSAFNWVRTVIAVNTKCARIKKSGWLFYKSFKINKDMLW